MSTEYLGNVTPGVTVHWFQVDTFTCGIRVTQGLKLHDVEIKFINAWCNEMEYNSNTAARLQALHDEARKMGLPV